MNAILDRFAAISDIGHIGLLLWAVGASVLLSRTLSELSAANRRFDDFVRELARFNQRHVHQSPVAPPDGAPPRPRPHPPEKETEE